MSGELTRKGYEQVQEGQDSYREIQDNVEQDLEERNRNQEIIPTLEGVDDTDKTSIEDAKEQGKAIAEQLAESRGEAPKNEVNSRMENTINEMRNYESREQDDASKASAMDGNYEGVGSSLESKFQESAKEFNDIATSGEEIKESSNEQINERMQNLRADW